MHRRELSHLIELKLQLERIAGARLVLPADPTGGVVVLQALGPDFAVGQLAKAVAQIPIPVAVVGGVEELLVAALVALRHRVRDNAVVPLAAVNLHTHANGARVIAVRHEADFTRVNRRVQLALRVQVRVAVAFDHLQKNKKRENLLVLFIYFFFLFEIFETFLRIIIVGMIC